MMIAIIFLTNCPSDNKPSTGSENCKEGKATLCFSRECTNCNSGITKLVSSSIQLCYNYRKSYKGQDNCLDIGLCGIVLSINTGYVLEGLPLNGY